MILRIRDADGNVQEVLAIKGNDGTSVTVASVSESTEDGGSNVITFSDGKTVTIKNGSKGEDYVLTAADKEEIANMVKAMFQTEDWTFTLDNGSTVTKTVVLL